MTATAPTGEAEDPLDAHLGGPPKVPEPPQVDQTAPFRPAIIAVRVATMAVSLVLSVPAIANGEWSTVAWVVLILAYDGFRLVQPVRVLHDQASLARILVEVCIHAIAILVTGSWTSPLVFSLMTGIVLAGFARGFRLALSVAAASALVIGLPDLADNGLDGDVLRTWLQWATLLLLVATVAGYARHINVEADLQHSLALDRVGRLSDANALLFALHRVAQTLPSSLDLDEVLESTMRRVDDLFTFETAALLLYDDTGGGWRVLRTEGNRIPVSWPANALPAPAQEAVSSRSLISARNLAHRDPGFAPESRSGLYAPLVGRERVVGLVVVERREAEAYTPRDADLLDGFVGPASLAVDNALWFNRLRTVGADEERTRIARDLHDRIGQSLAYLAFELDRIVKAEGRGDDLGPSLERLRSDVRGVIGEVRDTLYDLRTDVSERSDLARTLTEYVERIKGRTKLDVRLDLKVERSLPLRQERELFRIAQEALANVERHSGADRCLVRWWCQEGTGLLEIRDDGRGFAAGKDGRLDSYGILGMRERADSIGATLDVDSVEGVGSTIRCHLIADGRRAR